MQLTFSALKARQRKEREAYSENLGLRVHRTLSWLCRSEKETEDIDSQFIFLWIAFNSAYANEFHDNQLFTEQETFRNFIKRLCDLDKDKRLADLVWSEFASSIRLLLKNKYVFAGFWEYQRENKTEEQWLTDFKKANNFANKALGKKDTAAVLSVIFSRLYTLRNQIIHGGATWNSSVNIDQKRDAVNFLAKFVPYVVEIMMDNSSLLWGSASYPVVKD